VTHQKGTINSKDIPGPLEVISRWSGQAWCLWWSCQ